MPDRHARQGSLGGRSARERPGQIQRSARMTQVRESQAGPMFRIAGGLRGAGEYRERCACELDSCQTTGPIHCRPVAMAMTTGIQPRGAIRNSVVRNMSVDQRFVVMLDLDVVPVFRGRMEMSHRVRSHSNEECCTKNRYANSFHRTLMLSLTNPSVKRGAFV